MSVRDPKDSGATKATDSGKTFYPPETPTGDTPRRTPSSHPAPVGGRPASEIDFDLLPGELIYENARRGIEIRRVLNPEANRYEAVKIFRLFTPLAREQCRQELQAQAKLNHPNILHVYGRGTDSKCIYLVMEFAEGGTLQQYVAQRGKLEPRQAAVVMRTLARATHYAHEQGIIHRDLKPSNILLQPGDSNAGRALGGLVPKLADFGIALTREQAEELCELGAVGTPGYMAPEQCGHRSVDRRTDVYGLGAVLYFLVTGRAPFGTSRQSNDDLIREVASSEKHPVPVRQLRPEVPVDLEAICHKCLVKDPAGRYQDAEQLEEDLNRFVLCRETQARPWSSRERVVDWSKRHQAGIIVTVALGLLAWIALQFVLMPIWRDNELCQEGVTKLGHIEDLLVSSAQPRGKPDHRKACEDELPRALELIPQDSRRIRPVNRLLAAKRCAEVADLVDNVGYRDRALEAYKKAVELYRHVAADDYHPELCEVLLKCASLHVQLARPTEAQRELDEILVRAHGSAMALQARQHRAEAFHLQGQLHLTEAERDKAIEAFGSSIDLRNLLVKESTAPEYRRDLARGHGYLGDVYLEVGKPKDAWREYQIAEDHRRKLVEHLRQQGPKTSPADLRDARQQLARSRSNEGFFRLWQGQPDEASLAYDDARRMQKELLADSNDVELRDDNGWCSLRLAELLLEREATRTDWTRGLAEHARKTYDDLVLMNPNSVNYRINQARANLVLAKFDVRRSAAKAAEARAHLEEANRILLRITVTVRPAAMRNSDRVDLHYYQALTCCLLAELSEGDQVNRQLFDVMGHLRNAISAGYRNGAELRRDTALKLLRERRAESFQYLLERLGEKK